MTTWTREQLTAARNSAATNRSCAAIDWRLAVDVIDQALSQLLPEVEPAPAPTSADKATKKKASKKANPSAF